MRFPLLATMVVLAAFPTIASAQAASTAAPVAGSPSAKPHAPYSTADTEIGTLLDDPAARAILAKHVPAIVANDQIDQARGMTLQGIQPYSGDMLSDDILKKIDVDLAALPKAK